MLVIVLQAVACGLGIYQSRTENKKNIYLTTFLFNMSCLLVYLAIGEISTVLSYILITVRSYIYMFKDKLHYHIIPIGFIVIHLIVGFMSITNPWQLLSILAPSFTCFYMWYGKDTQQLRLGNIVNASLWLVYNIYCGLYILCINRVITIGSNVIAYVQKRHSGK